jgi:glycosyltransferase involved in cell wall biosynthesis
VFKIIAVSSEVKKYLQNRTLCPIQVILNPIVIRNLKGIRNFSKPSFVFVGRLNKQKNPLLAIKAFGYALKNNLIPPNSKFNFVGDGPLFKEIETFIESNSLKKSAKLLGFLNLNEISKIYSQSMTLVSTSEYEGFSLARVEAASSGCAVVTTMTSGILGVLTKSEQNKKLITGIFIVESDFVKIAHVLRESLAKKYWVTNSISERKNILKNHDPKSIAGKYLVN